MNEFEVPLGYYISFDAGPTTEKGSYKLANRGECYVEVYRSLDKGHGSPPVEHTIRAGRFLIPDAESLRVSELFEKIRSGIEKIVKSTEERI